MQKHNGWPLNEALFEVSDVKNAGIDVPKRLESMRPRGARQGGGWPGLLKTFCRQRKPPAMYLASSYHFGPSLIAAISKNAAMTALGLRDTLQAPVEIRRACSDPPPPSLFC